MTFSDRGPGFEPGTSCPQSAQDAGERSGEVAGSGFARTCPSVDRLAPRSPPSVRSGPFGHGVCTTARCDEEAPPSSQVVSASLSALSLAAASRGDVSRWALPEMHRDRAREEAQRYRSEAAEEGQARRDRRARHACGVRREETADLAWARPSFPADGRTVTATADGRTALTAPLKKGQYASGLPFRSGSGSKHPVRVSFGL